jgi:hypothetical protein
LLGHVAEPQAVLPVDRFAVPERCAAIGRGEPEDAAHRRGLAGAIRAEEAHEAARPGSEARAIEGDHVAVALGKILDLEHLGVGSPCWRSVGA